MKWSIRITDTCKKELNKLDKQFQTVILKYLYTRVSKLDHPRLLGEPLRHDLKGLWRYRVGKFRIVCRIQEETLVVLIVQIGHRSDVYK